MVTNILSNARSSEDNVSKLIANSGTLRSLTEQVGSCLQMP
jgi:hypothetical protein